MDWRLKCAALHALRFCPRWMYSILQRHVTGRYWFDVTDADLDAYGFHVQHFGGGRAVEFGAGSNLLVPLMLSAAGASEVLAYDLNPIATVEQVNHVIRQLAGRIPGDWRQVDALEDLEALYGIHYVSPADISRSGLLAHSVDFIYSSSTLEHIPKDQIEAILLECKRIAKPGARLSFIIDYHDHYASADKAIDRFNFYRYEDAMWRIFNPPNHFQSRLRHSDYEQLFLTHGFSLAVNRVVVPADSPREFKNLATPFRHYSTSDLVALNGFFLLEADSLEAQQAAAHDAG